MGLQRAGCSTAVPGVPSPCPLLRTTGDVERAGTTFDCQQTDVQMVKKKFVNGSRMRSAQWALIKRRPGVRREQGCSQSSLQTIRKYLLEALRGWAKGEHYLTSNKTGKETDLRYHRPNSLALIPTQTDYSSHL